jgi:two-component system cell cycle response regulator
MYGKPIKVLLIEDNPGDARLIREMLSEVGSPPFDLQHADRLSTGLERLAAGGIDVILLDLQLPESQELDTFRRVYAQAPHVPIVVLTVLGYETLALQTVHEGAQDYLFKAQVDANLLARAIRYAIERKHSQEALQESERRLRTIIEKNVDGIVVVDGKGVVQLVNSAAESILDRKAEDLVGESFGFPAAAGETTELDIVRRGGGTTIAEMRVVEIELHGETRYMASLRDITELVRLRETFRMMAMVDELTGLYNRRGFLALTEQQLKLAKRTKRGALLLYADLDHMKWINDTLGHPEGDRALIETADVLRETFRESDVIARIGGDEFVVLALETWGAASAEAIATRLQRKLEACNTGGDHRYELSLSMGIAHYDPECPCSIDELLNRADTLMYEQKQNKQNGDVRRET